MTERPRILVVITQATVGGAQTFLAHLLPAVARQYEVVVASHGSGPLRTVAEAVAEYVPLRHLSRDVNPLHDARALAELFALCRRVRPHVVHANSSKAGVLGMLAAAGARVPVRVFTANGWPFLWWGGARGRAYLLADRLIGRLATTVVCVSQAERRAALSAAICPPERIVVIRNAVDVAHAARAHVGDSPPTILSVGRLAAPKDFTTLVRALGRLEPGSFQAWIAGDGPGHAALQGEIDALGLRGTVRLLGGRDDVPDLLARADVFVLSSFSEGLPLSIIEAMAAGVPVVGTSVGGIPELLEGCGFVVAPGDPRALADAVAPLVADPALRRRHGELARRRAEAEFDLPQLHHAYLGLYARELARAGVGAP